MPQKKKWTVMVWMAGDNDLEDFGTGDIGELKRVGSTKDVHVVAQLDRMDDNCTRRYYLRKGTSIDADAVAELDETNTGDPRVAVDFFTWAMKTYPAQRYLTVIWNHGSGIDETDVYKRAAARGVSVVRGARPSSTVVPRERVRAITTRKFRRALFSTTIEAAVTNRAIAYDDTAADFLDNVELKRVLAQVKKKVGRKIDLVGFDACLMNMVEVAYQLRQDVALIVGSQETEPGDGWPYDKVLADLAAKPTMTPAELGKKIVQRYAASYASDSVTQSLLDLERLTPLATAIDKLAVALVKAIKQPVEFAGVTKAIRDAQHFQDTRDFIDLHDLCAHLCKRVKDPAVQSAASATMTLINPPKGIVAAEAHKGASVKGARGVSIYFPRGDVSVAYDKLDFAKGTKWNTFIKAYNAS